MWTAALWVGWREELRWGGQKRPGVKTPNLRESFAFGRKVGTRESFSFACIIFLRGNVLRLFVCKHLATRKRVIFRVGGVGG